jgi:hypothetical protein
MKHFQSFVVLLMLCTGVMAADETPVLDAMDLDAIRAKAGTEAFVTGQVTEIGTTKDGGITFINIGMPKKQGFVAVIFRQNYADFPEGFEKYRSQKVKVRGAIDLYRTEQPQIVLRSPEQISIVTE